MENIEQIISVSGIDIIYFGIFDLSKEYNLKITDKKLIKIVENGMSKCQKYKKEIGLMNIDKNSHVLSKKFNAKFIVNDVDTNLIGKILS
jgi:2-keto-3-deoxy-L-rhamnonate aldolase RhmA